MRESQRLKIAGHPLVWETGYALYNALGHYLPGYPDEIVELARQQVNDALNHFAVVARADVKSPGGGGSRLAARRAHRVLIHNGEMLARPGDAHMERPHSQPEFDPAKPRSGPQRSEDTRSGRRAEPGA